MGKVSVQVLDNGKPVLGKKTKNKTKTQAQYATMAPPCVQTCTQSHDKHTFSSQSKPVSLLICLYI